MILSWRHKILPQAIWLREKTNAVCGMLRWSLVPEWSTRSRSISFVCGLWSRHRVKGTWKSFKRMWQRRGLSPATVGPLLKRGHPHVSGSCPAYSCKKEVLLKVCSCRVRLSFSIKLNPNHSLSELWRVQGLISGRFTVQITDPQNHLAPRDIE